MHHEQIKWLHVMPVNCFCGYCFLGQFTYLQWHYANSICVECFGSKATWINFNYAFFCRHCDSLGPLLLQHNLRLYLLLSFVKQKIVTTQPLPFQAIWFVCFMWKPPSQPTYLPSKNSSKVIRVPMAKILRLEILLKQSSIK